MAQTWWHRGCTRPAALALTETVLLYTLHAECSSWLPGDAGALVVCVPLHAPRRAYRILLGPHCAYMEQAASSRSWELRFSFYHRQAMATEILLGADTTRCFLHQSYRGRCFNCALHRTVMQAFNDELLLENDAENMFWVLSACGRLQAARGHPLCSEDARNLVDTALQQGPRLAAWTVAQDLYEDGVIDSCSEPSASEESQTDSVSNTGLSP